ncbi:esterase-like activity of phytase family protein [Methylobacterium aquaticum]|uniref:esterase-like activity of phytase family protein n=1 Tax=Methylobacterium aquaticum TaxID=270351 RepID=UPI003D1626B8
MASSPSLGNLRVATFNASLNRTTEGQLVRDLSTPGNAQARNVAEIIQRSNPDVLLVNEFDFDRAGPNGTSLAADLFRTNYLRVSQNGATPVDYPYVFVAPSNTGIASGFDLDNNGAVVTTPGAAGYGNDAYGFGDFPGQYGMAIFSKVPIDASAARTFQTFLWKDMPGARLPDDTATAAPQDYYSPAELDVFRLSSKSHWDVPVTVAGETVHILASHPTPPTFDGPEDRNGLRNADEIRFFADYIQPGKGDYIYDDRGQFGGLAAGSRFVILGDQNADPLDGDSVAQAARQFLDSPLVDASVTPTSLGGPQQAALQGGANRAQRGDPRVDTADFADTAPGNLRVDYVLPSQVGLEPVSGSVFWPVNTDPLFRLVGTFDPSLPGGFPSSDHRLTSLDLALTADSRQEVAGIRYLGQSILPTGTLFSGTEVGGLSGIAYDAKAGTYLAISDDRSQIDPARFYTLTVDLSDGRLDQGDVAITGVTRLTQNSATFPALSLDPEGIALTGRGVFVSSEGEATAQRLTDPFVRLFDRSGAQVEALPVDGKYSPNAAGTAGVRNNLAFESLTVTPDQGTLYTATENALASDGPAGTTASGSASRILRYDLATDRATGEFVYVTDPVVAAAVPASGFSTAGLVDLLALDDRGTLLALERSFSVGVGNAIKLYQISTEGATDVSDRRSLATQVENGRLTVPGVTPVKKELLFDLSTLGIPLDNVEGLTLGPKLPDGRQSLVLVSDNNFDRTAFTQVLAFALDIRADDGISVTPVSGGNQIEVRDPTALGTAQGSAGTDTVRYAGSGRVVLPSNVENAVLTGDGAVTGNALDNAITGAGGNRIATGAGNDLVTAGPGLNVIDGGAGTDTLVLGFRLADATVTRDAAATLIVGPGARDQVTGFERVQFTDTTVVTGDGAPLVDDLFYLANNKDVLAAGQDADAHYAAYGWKEGRDPNALFSTTGYLAANPTVRASGQNPLDQYDQVGWKEGRDPSAAFDNEQYLARNADVKAAGLDPLRHFIEYGQGEGREIYAAIGKTADLAAHPGFDAEFYLLSYADVARAATASGKDPFAYAYEHYQTYGWKEGRNPNAVFDTKGYLNAYGDVRAAGIDPLMHYDQYGWKEGRDPSKGFDSTAYLAAFGDVAQARLDPMQHYLQYGATEGRSTFGDTTFGVGTVG